jgi:hypothetical protein
MFGLQLFLAGCDLAGAALGVCDCGSAVSEVASFQICAEESWKKSTERVGAAQPEPLRLCEYYVNGTIDQPTLGIIRAWVPVGSRSCIGDQPPSLATKRNSQEGQLEDIFGANSDRAMAWWFPGGELEVDEMARFIVDFPLKQVSGQLLSRPADIRFVADSASWSFPDGQVLAGYEVNRTFAELGTFKIRADVRVRIDYRYAGGDWILAAHFATIQSNAVVVEVIEKPRRTLLVTN